MYQGFPMRLPLSAGTIAQSLKGTGVGTATLSAVQKFSGGGDLVGEGVATLTGSLGHIGTPAATTGEGYVATPLFNQYPGTFATITGEGIDNSSIGIGAITAMIRGDMEKVVYDIDDNGTVDEAQGIDGGSF
jgi:hypothetical protein